MAVRIEMPQLRTLYGQAVLGAARAKLPGLRSTPPTSQLPQASLLARHPGVSLEQAERYRRLFSGEPFDGAHRTALPSVLVHIIGFPVQMALMSREDFPLPLMGLVHLANRVEHLRPIRLAQPVQVLVSAENLRAHRRGTQVDIRVLVLEDSADPENLDESAVLWRGVSTYLSRGIELGEQTPPDAAETVRKEFIPPVKTASWRLGAGAGRSYAAVSGDYNPIHVSNLAAKALGMPSAILHGMYSAGRMLEGREPEGAGHSWSIDFAAPVALPATVAFAVEHVDASQLRFTGWNPRKSRLHFSAELQLG
ncbi:MaoC/PaaZ C-terminal domain-containing protein [Nesterenkonia halotolerans]|uniref:Acyl dehydratase n=1 Tax=Nesterenkonia halotolerans TaxID=225325 RepID=A0ABR9J5D4_9MICC|nr:MaoC/PaaZ C-terminal domain-containing protein [Nesterenkonia halotolerans]MBE1513806.1 acyl dehydratase [Nesterenkonia halotolerans]